MAGIDDAAAFKVSLALAWMAAGAAAVVVLALVARLVTALFPGYGRPGLDDRRTHALAALIVARPGLSFGDLVRTTGWTVGGLRRHLRALLLEERIVAHRQDENVRFFGKGFSMDPPRASTRIPKRRR